MNDSLELVHTVKSSRGISISASSAGQIAACPGSYWLSRLNDMPIFHRSTDTKLSDAGTQLHADVENAVASCAGASKTFDEFRNALLNWSGSSEVMEVIKPIHTVAWQWYLSLRRKYPRKRLKFAVMVEPRIWAQMELPVSGQADLLVWEGSTDSVLIADYKSGFNAKDATPQLECLSSLAMHGEIRTVTHGRFERAVSVRAVGIVKQIDGKTYGVREDTDGKAILSKYHPDELSSAVANRGSHIEPGDHCTFCPAMHLCPVMSMTVRGLPEMQKSIMGTELTKENVEAVYRGSKAAEAIKDWFSQRLKSGYPVPGRKLTNPSPQAALTDPAKALKVLEDWTSSNGDSVAELRDRLQPRKYDEKAIIGELTRIVTEVPEAAELIVTVPGSPSNIAAKE